MRQRALRIAKPAAVIAVIGFAYLIFHELTGLSLFCPYRTFLHVYCPGCGISRMFFHLAHLELAEAFASNCVAFCLLPAAVFEMIFHGYRYIRYGNGRFFKAERIALYVLIGVLIAFGIARNIWQVYPLVPEL